MNMHNWQLFSVDIGAEKKESLFGKRYCFLGGFLWETVIWKSSFALPYPKSLISMADPVKFH